MQNMVSIFSDLHERKSNTGGNGRDRWGRVFVHSRILSSSAGCTLSALPLTGSCRRYLLWCRRLLSNRSGIYRPGLMVLSPDQSQSWSSINHPSHLQTQESWKKETIFRLYSQTSLLVEMGVIENLVATFLWLNFNLFTGWPPQLNRYRIYSGQSCRGVWTYILVWISFVPCTRDDEGN